MVDATKVFVVLDPTSMEQPSLVWGEDHKDLGCIYHGCIYHNYPDPHVIFEQFC